jgi:hypothetical protein
MAEWPVACWLYWRGTAGAKMVNDELDAPEFFVLWPETLQSADK